MRWCKGYYVAGLARSEFSRFGVVDLSKCVFRHETSGTDQFVLACGSNHDQVSDLKHRFGELDSMCRTLKAAIDEVRKINLRVAPAVCSFCSCWPDVVGFYVCFFCQRKKASTIPECANAVEILNRWKMNSWMSEINNINADAGSVARLAQRVVDVKNEMFSAVAAVIIVRKCGSMRAVSGTLCVPAFGGRRGVAIIIRCVVCLCTQAHRDGCCRWGHRCLVADGSGLFPQTQPSHASQPSGLLSVCVCVCVCVCAHSNAWNATFRPSYLSASRIL